MTDEEEKPYEGLPALTEYEKELRRVHSKDRAYFRYNAIMSALWSAKFYTKQPLPRDWDSLKEEAQLEYLLALKAPEQIDKGYKLLVRDADMLRQLDEALVLRIRYLEGVY